MRPFIDAAAVQSDDFERLARELRSYQRIESYFLLKASGLTVLDALFLFPPREMEWANIRERLSGKGWDAVLLRRDLQNRQRSKPRGGFLLSGDELERNVLSALDADFAAILHPPASRYDNLFAGNIVLSAGSPIVVELVGSGFDVSDLNRGDSVPHETFTFHGACLDADASELSRYLESHCIISPSAYRQAWGDRMNKVAAEMKCYTSASLPKPSAIERSARALRGECLFQNSSRAYTPIGFPVLRSIWRDVHFFWGIYASWYSEFCAVSISFSHTTDYGLVFWDVYAPEAGAILPDARR